MTDKKSSLFFKIIFSVGVMLLLGAIAGGLGKLLVFFNTGSNRETMLNTVPDIPNEYTPKINWLADDEDTGRPMEDFNRQIISRDYVRALYQRNLALLSADTSSLKEYYTVDARPKVYAAVRLIDKENRAIQKAELNHNLKLHFYSADGQLASFTDFAVESRQRVIDIEGDRRIFSDSSVADFQVLMQLDDGFWRIKHLIREEATTLADSLSQAVTSISEEQMRRIRSMKGVNYYPQKTPWKDFWLNYDEKIIAKDLKIIKKLRLNTVRVFINYEQFGKGNVVPEMLERLNHFLDTAEKNKLGVMVTLFDFNSNYNLLNFPATDRQLETILTRFKNHPAILAWDLKNEPDLDFYYQNEFDVKEWLSLMVRQAKKYDNSHPITIGWAYPESASYLSEKLDFISFHYYRDVEELGNVIDTLKLQIGEKPLVLQEFGLSSYESSLFPISVSPKQQAEHLQKVQRILTAKGNIPYIYWTLYDFENVSSEIAGGRPWQINTQKHFGVIDINGNLKPVGKVLSAKQPNIKVSTLEKIPLYLISYLLIGVIFAGIFIYSFPFIKKLFKR
ncbi:MAG: cellulase family glycosylhydrolase [Spirosomaceae bacterium]|nr:cellulase family glycosylhydrolase [Spirosomataceae bacterium]